MEIVGVVTNGRTDDLTQAAAPGDLPIAVAGDGVFQAPGDPHRGGPALHYGRGQRELRSVDPTVAVESPKTLEQIRGDSLASRTFAMQLLVGFSLVGSVLTLVGIYGVLSLSVASRRREFAIRTAVGAEQRRHSQSGFRRRIPLDRWRCGLRHRRRHRAVARSAESFLFEVEPADPVTLIGVGLLFAVVALLACWVPVRRAAKVDPLEALRYE